MICAQNLAKTGPNVSSRYIIWATSDPRASSETWVIATCILALVEVLHSLTNYGVAVLNALYFIEKGTTKGFKLACLHCTLNLRVYLG
jgi:hypothetical protein